MAAFFLEALAPFYRVKVQRLWEAKQVFIVMEMRSLP